MKDNYLKKHNEAITDALVKIREEIAFTPNIPVKRLIELTKQHMDIQGAGQFVNFLDIQYNGKPEEKKEESKSKLITM